jgi:hypothetical protein
LKRNNPKRIERTDEIGAIIHGSNITINESSHRPSYSKLLGNIPQYSI